MLTKRHRDILLVRLSATDHSEWMSVKEKKMIIWLLLEKLKDCVARDHKADKESHTQV